MERVLLGAANASAAVASSSASALHQLCVARRTWLHAWCLSDLMARLHDV